MTKRHPMQPAGAATPAGARSGPRLHALRGAWLHSPTLPRAQYVALAIAGAVMALSGLVLVFLRYVAGGNDPLSAWPHPAWPWVIAVHVLAAPVAVFLVGSTWWNHVARHWALRHRRASGAWLVGSTAVVVFSGYALYLVGDEALLERARVLHAIAGGAAIAAASWHSVRGRVRRRRARAASSRRRA